MDRFEIIIERDERDPNMFVASVKELPGCISQGRGLIETMNNIADAVEGHLHVLGEN